MCGRVITVLMIALSQKTAPSKFFLKTKSESEASKNFEDQQSIFKDSLTFLGLKILGSYLSALKIHIVPSCVPVHFLPFPNFHCRNMRMDFPHQLQDQTVQDTKT